MTGIAARKALIVLALLAAWEAWTRLFHVSPLLFPPASTVLAAFGRSLANGEIPGYAVQSLKILLTGMACGVAIALVLTTLAVTTRLGGEVLQTLTSMFNPLPAIALMPLALLWFGLGTGSLVFVIIHSVLWPMSLNTYTGFVTVPTTLRRVGQNFGLVGWRLVVGILLPAAFPYILISSPASRSGGRSRGGRSSPRRWCSAWPAARAGWAGSSTRIASR